MDDLHILPKFRDSMTHVYVERARIDREAKSIAIWDEQGMTPIPAAALCVLMLGPGTAITQAAIAALAGSASRDSGQKRISSSEGGSASTRAWCCV